MGKQKMTNITVLTTFHQEGLDVYGQRFLDSFAKNIDKRIKLLVYAEACTPINPDPDQITILDAVESLPKLVAFKEKWGNIPKANGIPPDDIKARRPRDWHKEFKWDAVRFANKTYAVYDAVTRSKDWCVWMDADTFVHSPWSYDDFVAQLPNDCWITYVGRGKGSQTWPECGFYGMNVKHPMCKQFLAEFQRFYVDANNGIFELEEWHDSYIFDVVRKQLETDNNIKNINISDLGLFKLKNDDHVFVASVLGQFMDHKKGNRKQSKWSHELLLRIKEEKEKNL